MVLFLVPFSGVKNRPEKVKADCWPSLFPARFVKQNWPLFWGPLLVWQIGVGCCNVFRCLLASALAVISDFAIGSMRDAIGLLCPVCAASAGESFAQKV